MLVAGSTSTQTTVMTLRLAGRRLYIADLARRQAALEDGRTPMNPVGYRVLAKRLRSALAGQSPQQLSAGFRELPRELLPLLMEAVEARHFDEYGVLCGPGAPEVGAATQSLIGRLRRPGSVPR